MERTLVLIKPDALQRSLVGEITQRFELRGLKLVGMKLMQLDSKILKEHYAHLMGKQALLYPEIRTVDQILKKIDAVTADEVLRLARELFEENRFRLALIGPFEDPGHFEKLIHY